MHFLVSTDFKVVACLVILILWLIQEKLLNFTFFNVIVMRTETMTFNFFTCHIWKCPTLCESIALDLFWYTISFIYLLYLLIDRPAHDVQYLHQSYCCIFSTHNKAIYITGTHNYFNMYWMDTIYFSLGPLLRWRFQDKVWPHKICFHT